MTAIVIASQQIAVALEVVAIGPSDPRYRWAMEYLAVHSRSVLAAMRDPRERTRLATAIRVARREEHRTRAIDLKRAGHTAERIGELIAEEEGRGAFPYDGRTVRRWYAKAGISSR
ncbi:MAG TPA: hypothetical protein VGK16_02065 [Candidatus Limnocylindrales bacterium]|jgi:hypothetical protein